MLKLEEFFLLRDLHEQGLSISEMSRQTGLGRRTVRKYVQSMKPPEPAQRKGTCKLDDYKDYIAERLSQYPLSAKRLLREIKARGYRGQYTILRNYIKSIRLKIGVPAVFRFETEPGGRPRLTGRSWAGWRSMASLVNCTVSP